MERSLPEAAERPFLQLAEYGCCIFLQGFETRVAVIVNIVLVVVSVGSTAEISKFVFFIAVRTSIFDIPHKPRREMHFPSVVERPVVRRENRENWENWEAIQTVLGDVNSD